MSVLVLTVREAATERIAAVLGVYSSPTLAYRALVLKLRQRSVYSGGILRYVDEDNLNASLEFSNWTMCKLYYNDFYEIVMLRYALDQPIS